MTRGVARNTIVQLMDFVPDSWRTMEQFLLALATALRDQGWRTVHVFAGPPSERVVQLLAKLDSPFLISTNPLSSTRARELGQHLSSYSPTVIHTNFLSMFDPALRAVKKLSGARRLVVTDQSSGAASKKVLPLLALAWLRGRWASTYVDQIIGVSEYVCRRDQFDVFFPGSKIRRIYNGIDIRRYIPPPERPTNDAFTIAFVGQLIPQKGLATLMTAVKILTAEGRGIRLQIAGRGHQDDALRALSGRLGLGEAVDFLGQIDWTHQLFAQADVVVVPSEWEEAFGFVAAEAGACGACLVVSDAGGLPEVVGADGKAGRIFRRGQASDLAKVLREVMDDSGWRERMRAAVRERMVSHFSLDNTVSEYVRYITSL